MDPPPGESLYGGKWKSYLNVTNMVSLSITIKPNDLKSGEDPLLTVMSAGHTLLVFINGQLSGTLSSCVK